MHIPACQTSELALMDFDRALARALLPSPDYDVGRWLYVPNTYSEYRYILGIPSLADSIAQPASAGKPLPPPGRPPVFLPQEPHYPAAQSHVS